MIPGDPAKVMAPTATVEQQQAIRDSMGLEKSIPEQFKMYMVNLFHGDLGESYFSPECYGAGHTFIIDTADIFSGHIDHIIPDPGNHRRTKWK